MNKDKFMCENRPKIISFDSTLTVKVDKYNMRKMMNIVMPFLEV